MTDTTTTTEARSASPHSIGEQDESSLREKDAKEASEIAQQDNHQRPDETQDESEKTSDVSAKPSPPEPERPKRSKAKIAILMFSLGLAVFLAALDITIVTTALPTICEDFNSTSGYTWIGSAFLLASAATIPLWGKVSDIFGRKPALLLANIVFFVGSTLSAASVNMGMLIGGRAVQGAGGGGLVVLVNIVIGDLFSMRERGQYYGIIGGVWALASAIGPLVGGAFTGDVSWRWCFYINLPLDGLAFVILLFFLDIKTPRTPLWDGLRAIDWPGVLSVVGGTLMVLLGLEYGGVTFPWDSAAVICLIIFGCVVLGLFVVNEAFFATYPIVPGRIFANKRTSIAAMSTNTSHGLTFIGGSYFLPLYFQACLGASPLLSGVYLLPCVLGLSLTSALTGVIIRKTGRYLPPIVIGMALMTLGNGLYHDLDANSPWSKIIIYQLIAGIGVGPNFQAPLIALQAHSPPKDIAAITSTFAFVRQLSTATSVVLGNVVFQNAMSDKMETFLRAGVPPKLAGQLSGGSAGASVEVVGSLPSHQRTVVREAYADSLSTMWIMFVCFSAAGLICSCFIGQKTLNKSHVETKTGLDAERERAVDRSKKKVQDVEAAKLPEKHESDQS